MYAKLLGWQVEVDPDPRYGGYGSRGTDGKDVARMGPKMDPNGPTAWNLHIRTDDVDELTRKVQGARRDGRRGAVNVRDQGRKAIYRDPAAPAALPGRGPDRWLPDGQRTRSAGPRSMPAASTTPCI